jgi:glycine oxidase
MLEVVVVGGGIAGFAAALALWERGAAVTIVETTRPGSGSTGASAGMVVAQYEAGEAGPKFQLSLESRSRYPEFAARLEELAGRSLHLRWDGMLVANLNAEEHAGALASGRWQRELGLEAEVLDPAEAERLQPGVSLDVPSYAWLPSEGQLDTQELGEIMEAAIGRTEIRLISGNGVAEILSKGGAVVGVEMEDGRTLEAERVILAAGAWSSKVAGLPRPLPVRPIRGQILRFHAGAIALQRLVASHAGRYLVPRHDGTVLAGSTMEDVGFDRSISEEGLHAIHASVSQLYPTLVEHRPIERWAGLRPISADSYPIIGPDPELEGLLYATGYGRDGITISPFVGSIVADLAVKGMAEYDWRPFGPERLGGAAT